MKFLFGIAAGASLLLAAELATVSPEGAKPVGPYSPGILFDDVLYVSGQSARDSSGDLPDTPEAQARQCLANVRSVVEAARLSLANVVYTHVYLAHMEDYAAVNRLYAAAFPGIQPARSTIGVARMPVGTPIEMSAIAVRGIPFRPVLLPGSVSPVPLSPGILAADRLFLSAILGRDADANSTPITGTGQIDLCINRLSRLLAAAQLAPRHMLHLNVYRTAALSDASVESRFRAAFPDAALSFIETAALPFGVHIGATGVAALSLATKRVHRTDGRVDCAAAGRTVYCASITADTPGEALRALETSLHAMGSSLSATLATTVYMSDIETFPNMNAVYALQFSAPFPARTTVQPRSPGPTNRLAISLVAAKLSPHI